MYMAVMGCMWQTSSKHHVQPVTAKKLRHTPFSKKYAKKQQLCIGLIEQLYVNM